MFLLLKRSVRPLSLQCLGSSPSVCEQRLLLKQSLILLQEEIQVVIINSAEMEVQTVFWGLDEKYKKLRRHFAPAWIPLYENLTWTKISISPLYGTGHFSSCWIKSGCRSSGSTVLHSERCVWVFYRAASVHYKITLQSDLLRNSIKCSLVSLNVDLNKYDTWHALLPVKVWSFSYLGKGKGSRSRDIATPFL